jgi:hypothetical protein
MSPTLVIVRDPKFQNPPQMSFSQWDEPVQTLTACGAHQALTAGIGFWGPPRSAQNPHSQSGHFLVQVPRVDAVALSASTRSRRTSPSDFPIETRSKSPTDRTRVGPPEQLIYAIVILQEEINKQSGTVKQVLNLA